MKHCGGVVPCASAVVDGPCFTIRLLDEETFHRAPTAHTVGSVNFSFGHEGAAEAFGLLVCGDSQDFTSEPRGGLRRMASTAVAAGWPNHSLKGVASAAWTGRNTPVGANSPTME
jgi:hypothetical protein